MTSPFLAQKGVSHVLPDGRTLFSELNEQFDVRPTGWSTATAWARPSWRASCPASCNRLRRVLSVPGACTHPPAHRGRPAAAGRLLSRGMASGPAPAYVELIAPVDR